MPEPRKPAKDIRLLLQQAAADLAAGSGPRTQPDPPAGPVPRKTTAGRKAAAPRKAAVARKATAPRKATPAPKTAAPRKSANAPREATAPRRSESPQGVASPAPAPWHTVRSAPAPSPAPVSATRRSGPVDMAAIDEELHLERSPRAPYQPAAGSTLTPSSTPTPSPAAPPPPAPRRERRSRKGLVVGAVVAVVALIGGGLGIALAVRDSGPSKADYIADADEICRPANGPVAAIVKPSSYPELATASATVVETTKGQLGQLRRLDQPGGEDRVQIDAVLTSLDGTVAATQKLQEAAGRSDDAATISATNDGRSAFNGAREKASAFGFGACATGLQSGVDNVFGGSQAVIKAGFVAKGEAACRAAVRKTDEVDEPRGPQEVSRYFEQIADVFDGVTAELKALAVPPGDEGVVGEMIAAVEKVNVKGRDYFDAIADEDEDRVLAMEKELNTLQTAADAKLDAYGLGTCGSNFGGE